MTLMSRIMRNDYKVAYKILFDALVREMDDGYTEHRLSLFNNLYRFLELLKYDRIKDDNHSYSFSRNEVQYYGADSIYECFSSCTPPEFTKQTFVEFLQANCQLLAFHSPFTVDDRDLEIFKTFLRSYKQALTDKIAANK